MGLSIKSWMLPKPWMISATARAAPTVAGRSATTTIRRSSVMSRGTLTSRPWWARHGVARKRVRALCSDMNGKRLKAYRPRRELARWRSFECSIWVVGTTKVHRKDPFIFTVCIWVVLSRFYSPIIWICYVLHVNLLSKIIYLYSIFFNHSQENICKPILRSCCRSYIFF